MKGIKQMLIAEMKDKIKTQRTIIITQAIFTAVIIINAMSIILLVKEKSYWQGYNEAYDTGTKNGWQSCIEENNLYERYENGEQSK